MISNELYEELKKLKKEESFTELIKDLLDSKRPKKGYELRNCLGILKKDKEWEEVEKTLKKGWKKWTNKYA